LSLKIKNIPRWQPASLYGLELSFALSSKLRPHWSYGTISIVHTYVTQYPIALRDLVTVMDLIKEGIPSPGRSAIVSERAAP
jgi:hypothetical protein